MELSRADLMKEAGEDGHRERGRRGERGRERGRRKEEEGEREGKGVGLCLLCLHNFGNNVHILTWA